MFAYVKKCDIFKKMSFKGFNWRHWDALGRFDPSHVIIEWRFTVYDFYYVNFRDKGGQLYQLSCEYALKTTFKPVFERLVIFPFDQPYIVHFYFSYLTVPPLRFDTSGQITLRWTRFYIQDVCLFMWTVPHGWVLYMCELILPPPHDINCPKNVRFISPTW